MQITIVQVEIEEAIINHVKSQVAVRDDQVITVDLRATRGADGYQAVIDISSPKGGTGVTPKSPEPTPPTPELKPSPAPLKPLGIAEAVAESKAKDGPNKDDPKAEATAPETIAQIDERMAEEAAAPVVAEKVVDATAKPKSPLFTPKAAAPVAEPIGGAVDAPAPTPSIFRSLKKPVNA